MARRSSEQARVPPAATTSAPGSGGGKYQRMMAAARAGLIQWVIVADQDRIGGKDEWHFASLIHDFRKSNVKVFTIDGAELTGDSTLSFFTGGLKAGASKESLHAKSKAVLRGKRSGAIAGEFQGGFVPYGLDVVCFADEVERWRLRWFGHFERKRIWPDGHTDDFNGKGNLPATEQKERLMLRPGDPERLKTVKWIFDTFANQSISSYQIAKALNERKIKPTYSDTWLGSHVSDVLRNNAYIGKPSWNKSGQGVYFEDDGTAIKPVQTSKDRRKPKTAWYMPEEAIFDPIIDQDTWYKVQAKLDQPKKKRNPKTAEMWLAGLVVCAGCGLRMRGQKRKHFCQFLCQTGDRRRIGKPGSCMRNTVHHDMIEEVIDKYLAEVGIALETLIKAQDDFGLLETLNEDFDNCFKLYVEASRMMGQTIQENKPESLDDLTGLGKTGRFLKIYQDALQGNKATLQANFDALDEQHNEVMDKIGNFEGRTRALNKLQEELGALEKKMDIAEERMKDQTDAFTAQLARMAEIRRAISIIRDGKETGLRARSEALRKIIDRIEVHFVPTGKAYPQSLPAVIQIFPKTGNDVRYAVCY